MAQRPARTSINAYTAAFFIIAALWFFLQLVLVDNSWLGNADDGIYAYAAWRTSHGAVPYRDFFLASPPLLIYLGALLLKISDSLLTLRAFSLVLMVLLAVLTRHLALELFDRPLIGFLAGLSYLALPLGVEYNRMFVLEPLMLVLLLGAVLATLRFDTRGGVAAGALCAAAVFTKLTALPFVALTVAYLLFRKRRMALAYCLSAAGVGLVLLGLSEALSRGSFLPSMARQASFPVDWAGLLGNIVLVLQREGPLMAAAGAGLALASRERPGQRIEYFALFSLVATGSIAFAARLGTYWHFFVVAEPSIAVGFAYLAVKLLDAVLQAGASRSSAGVAAAIFAGSCWAYPAILDMHRFTTPSTHDAVTKAVELLKARSRPDQEVFAYPYLAFLAQRRIVEDYGDIFMWRARYDFGDPTARDEVLGIAQRLRNGQIPVVALTYLMDLPPIREALRERYQLVGALPIDGRTELLVPN